MVTWLERSREKRPILRNTAVLCQDGVIALVWWRYVSSNSQFQLPTPTAHCLAL